MGLGCVVAVRFDGCEESVGHNIAPTVSQLVLLRSPPQLVPYELPVAAHPLVLLPACRACGLPS
jgi:hypothetical protein